MHLEADGYVIRIRGDKSIYRPLDMVGKSMDQLRKSGSQITGNDSEIFEKMSQAISSGLTIFDEVSAIRSVTGDGSLHSVLPVLVVPNETLWTVDYDESGAVQGEPQMADRAEYYIDRNSSQSFAGPWVHAYISHMEVVTVKGLSEMLVNYFYKNQPEGSYHPLVFGRDDQMWDLVYATMAGHDV